MGLFFVDSRGNDSLAVYAVLMKCR